MLLGSHIQLFRPNFSLSKLLQQTQKNVCPHLILETFPHPFQSATETQPSAPSSCEQIDKKTTCHHHNYIRFSWKETKAENFQSKKRMEKTHHIYSRIKGSRNKTLKWWFQIRFTLLSWMLEKQSQNNKRRRIWRLKCWRWRHINCSHCTDKFTHYGTEAQLKIGQRTFEGRICRQLHHKHCITWKLFPYFSESRKFFLL